MSNYFDRQKHIKNYLDNGHKVHGWLHRYSAVLISDLSQFQCQNEISGALGEIGVHMGRLFILLKLTALSSEKCFALDVFGQQQFNVDNSGFGDRDIFLRNVCRWTGDTDITVIQSSSLDVKPADLIDAVGRCRLVSVDGGHTEDITHSDLQLVESVLMERGVVILDDFFNQSWPGVAAGAAKYFLDPLTKLRPFAVSPNKIYLAAAAHHELYRNGLRRTQAEHFEKTVHMFGNDVDVFGCRVISLNQKIQSRIGKSKIGSSARFAKRLFELVG
jgi:hypothetical protein